MMLFPAVRGTAAIYEKNRAISSINSKGKIEVVSFKEKKDFFAKKIPFVRGISILFYGLYLFLISLSGSKTFFERGGEQKKTKPSFLVVLLSVVGITIFVACFMGVFIVPFFTFSLLENQGLGEYVVALIMALVRVGFFALALLGLRMVPSMRQVYRNNAAGNLAKASFESKKIQSYYLSTNFLNFVVWGFFISLFVLSFIIVEINFFLKFLINFSLVVCCYAIIYEFLKLFELKIGVFSKIIINPIAFLTAERPTQTEREIAFSAMNEVVLMHENEERLIGDFSAEGVAFSVVYSEVKQRLFEAGIEDIAETEWLVACALGKNRGEIKLLNFVSKEEYKKIKNALAKREKRMPISKIFNSASFFGRDFYVDKNVLSPRPETEQVVEEAIKEIKKVGKKPCVLDLMTGSGAIATTLALETNAVVFASDVSKLALEIAKKNAKKNGAKIKFVESDIFKGFKKEKFDVIVSNPPYIKSEDILGLDDEVKKFDPILALDGGEDGLYFYREIAASAPAFLKEGGTLVLEIGFNQGESVKKLLQKNFKNIKIKKDYGGNDRIVVATKK